MKVLIDNLNKNKMDNQWWRLMIIIWDYLIFNFKRAMRNRCSSNNYLVKDKHNPILKVKLNSSSPLPLKMLTSTVLSTNKMLIISSFRLIQIKKTSNKRDTSNKMIRCLIINRIHLTKSSIIRSFTEQNSHIMLEGNLKI